MVNAHQPQSNVCQDRLGGPSGRLLLEQWLPAAAQAVPPVRHRALGVCRAAGADEEDCVAIDLALGEALANAVMHSRPSGTSAGDADVCLRLWCYHDRLIIEIHDSGRGFEPPLPPYQMPPASAQETHGRGLPLMELLTDALCVCQGDVEEGGASIYLVKELHGEGQPPLTTPSGIGR